MTMRCPGDARRGPASLCCAGCSTVVQRLWPISNIITCGFNCGVEANLLMSQLYAYGCQTLGHTWYTGRSHTTSEAGEAGTQRKSLDKSPTQEEEPQIQQPTCVAAKQTNQRIDTASSLHLARSFLFGVVCRHGRTRTRASARRHARRAASWARPEERSGPQGHSPRPIAAGHETRHAITRSRRGVLVLYDAWWWARRWRRGEAGGVWPVECAGPRADHQDEGKHYKANAKLHPEVLPPEVPARLS